MAESERQDKGWCVLELMGHRKLAGYVTDDAGLLRIDVYLQGDEPEPDGDPPDLTPIATQWYGAGSIYCITATTRENCLALTRTHQPAPIGRWELPAARQHDDELAEAQLADQDEDVGWE